MSSSSSSLYEQNSNIKYYNMISSVLISSMNPNITITPELLREIRELANKISIYHPIIILSEEAKDKYEFSNLSCDPVSYCMKYLETNRLCNISIESVMNFLNMRDKYIKLVLTNDYTQCILNRTFSLLHSIDRFNESECCKINDLLPDIALKKYKSVETKCIQDKTITKSTCHLYHFNHIPFLIYMAMWIQYGISKGPYHMLFASFPMIKYFLSIIDKEILKNGDLLEQARNKNMIKRIQKFHDVIEKTISKEDYDQHYYDCEFRSPADCSISKKMKTTSTKIHHLNKQTDKIVNTSEYNEFTSILPIFRQIIIIIQRINTFWAEGNRDEKDDMFSDFDMDFTNMITMDYMTQFETISFIDLNYKSLSNLSEYFGVMTGSFHVQEILALAFKSWKQMILIFKCSQIPGKAQSLFISINDTMKCDLLNINRMEILKSDITIKECSDYILETSPYNNITFDVESITFNLSSSECDVILRRFHQLIV